MWLRQLGLIVIVLGFCLPGFSQEEKAENPFKLLSKDVYFQPGGGLRVRYENLRAATGGGFPENEDESQASHRAQFDIRLYKGEYIETFFRFLNFADWGGANGDSRSGQHDGFSRTNGLLVNQAWALWKVDDSLGIHFGRKQLHLGLGYTYGSNEWFNVPYSFDLLSVGWDWESLELSLIAAKVQEFERVSNQTLSSDPEENHYILNVDVKNLADAIDIFTFNLVQVNRDLGSPDGGLSVLNGLNMQRLSLEMGIESTALFGTFFLSYVTGEEKVAPVNQVNSNVQKPEIAQTAIDLKMGYRFVEHNNLGFWAGYHYDSGDEDASDDQVGSYDSFFYEVYGQAGLMDLIRWGNLSMFHAGLDVDIVDNITLGAAWWHMTKTEGSDDIQFGQAGRFYDQRVQNGDLIFGEEKDIGNEFDIWVDMKWQSGMNFRFTYAHFFPGAAFENADVTNSNNQADSNFGQFLVQIGYFF